METAWGGQGVLYLIGLGHRKIGYVGGIPQDLTLSRTPTERFAGYRRALADHGLPYQDSWVVEADWTAAGSYDAAGPFLDQPDRPTAVVAASDELAIGLIAAAQRRGLTVPGDLSVIGIDDYKLSEILGVTTVRQDVVLQGVEAATLLLSSMLEDAEQDDHRVVIPTELVVRRTTGPAPS